MASSNSRMPAGWPWAALAGPGAGGHRTWLLLRWRLQLGCAYGLLLSITSSGGAGEPAGEQACTGRPPHECA